MFEILVYFNKINKKRKIEALFVLLALTFITLLEVLSLSIIPVLLNLVLNLNSESMLYTYLSYIKLNNYSQIELLVYGLLFVSFIFLIKNIIIIFFNYYERNFFRKIHEETCSQLFNYYLKLNYLKIINLKLSKIVRNLTIEIDQFRSYLRNYFLILKESMIAVSFLIILLNVDFITTIILFIILFCLTSIYYLTFKKKLVNWGEQIQYNLSKFINLINNSVHSIKEIKSLDLENSTTSYLNQLNHIREKNKQNHAVLTSIPRLYLEFAGVLILFIICFYLFNKGNNFDYIIYYLSFVGIVSVRMIPSLSIIAGSLSSIKFHFASFNLIFNELEKSLKNNETVKKNYVTEFKNITLENINLNLASKNIISNFSLSISKGEKIAIVGPSGSGKTTITNILLGLIKPDSGKIIINGNQIKNVEISLSKIVGYLPQEYIIFDDTIKRNVVFFSEDQNIPDNKVIDALKISKVYEFVKSLPQGLDTILGERGLNISSGQRQRIALSRVLYSKPKIIICDEVTSSLDNLTSNNIINELMGMKDVAVIFITHRKDEKIKFDKVINLSKN